MPELAETLRIAEDLHKYNLHNLIEVKVTNLGQEWLPKKKFDITWFKYIKDRKIEWHAFGKQIVLRSTGGKESQYISSDSFENHDPKFLRISLGMTGRFKLESHLTETDKKHILFTMIFREGLVHFVDYRKFFQIAYATEGFMVFSGFSLLRLVNGNVEVNREVHISSPSKKPKIIELLDEGKYTGVGNYLANEGLGRCNLDPRIPFKDYDEKRYIMTTIQGVALESYATGGHSFNGGFIRPNGETGYFRPQIYGNESKYERTIFRGRPIWVRQA
jgi:formamidopyrimidine-DNA glycosylase